MENCPSPDQWLSIVRGEVPETDAIGLLAHAGKCDHCGSNLKEAVMSLPDGAIQGEEEFLKALRTSQPYWRRDFAKRLAAGERASSAWRWKWVAAAAAAVVVVGGLSVWYLARRGSSPPLGQLAKAYSSSRTIELRIPGAAYAPLTVQRARAHDLSPDLLESKAAIQRRLQSHPEDWIWLHAQARAELLEWQYDDAIRNLRAAMDLSGANSGDQYAEILVDLGTAYFERAQASGRPIDYSSAVEYLSKAIQISPNFAEAYFNRAIVLEKKFDYFQAAEDWKKYLALDPQGTWSQEARARLAELEVKMDASRHSDPKQLNKLVEYRLEAAMRTGFTDRDGASALAKELSAENHDNWLRDALAVREHPAVSVLAAMVDSRTSLRVSHFPDESERLAKLDSSSLPAPLRVWHGFETIFRVTHSPAVAFEPEGVGQLIQLAGIRSYSWFVGQILMERSSSHAVRAEWKEVNGNLMPARQIADQHRFPLLQLRVAGFLDINSTLTGRNREAAQIEDQELTNFWRRNTPWLTGQVYYGAAAWREEALGRLHAAMFSASAAAHIAALGGARETEAVNLARSAGFALSAGEPNEATPLLKRSQTIFAHLPQNRTTEDYRIFAECEYALGTGDNAVAERLANSTYSSSNPFVKVTSLRTLASLDAREGRWQSAETRLRAAILALLPVDSSTPIANRWRWRMELDRNSRELVTILLRENRVRDAFFAWQDYLRASALLLSGRLSPPAPVHISRGDVLTFARLGTRYGTWHQRGDALEFTWLDESAEEIDRVVRQYFALCSRPNSHTSQIRSSGKKLHGLLGPLFDKALASGKVVVQPDGDLRLIPWASLPVANTTVVADRAQISICPLPLLAAGPSSGVDLREALAVGADAISPSRLAEFRPLPGINQELAAVTKAAGRCTVLRGADATAVNIERNLSSATILHFAGHGISSPQGVSFLVAPAPESSTEPSDIWRPKPASCRNLTLAVLGACSTARHEELETVAPQSLPQLFLLAGTQHVIAALWDVDSRFVSDFMRMLYTQLRSGLAIELALRQTTASIREKEEWSSPYYWASFALFAR